GLRPAAGSLAWRRQGSFNLATVLFPLRVTDPRSEDKFGMFAGPCVWTKESSSQLGANVKPSRQLWDFKSFAIPALDVLVRFVVRLKAFGLGIEFQRAPQAVGNIAELA